MTIIPILKTPLGDLFETDCNDLLKSLEPETVGLAFADHPFNLGKQYKSNINDLIANHEYLDWYKVWLDGMIKALKPGGALMVWNLPKWNLPLGAYLSEHLTFHRADFGMLYLEPFAPDS